MPSFAKRLPVDLILLALALCGLAISIVAFSSARTSASDFSDLKTVYGSAWCFTHGTDPYSIGNIESVFVQQHIAVPATWFGHYPVYPPTTLALLAPFSLLSMTAAIYSLTAISTVVFIAAMVSLLRHYREFFQSNWGWKVLFVTLCAAGPLLSFALLVGNLSVLATAFGILAFTTKRRCHLWLPATSLAMAVLLKPHLGIWFGICMLLLRERTKHAIALRAACLVSGFGALVIGVLALKGNLAMQMQGLQSVLRLEAFPGSSMNVASHAVLPIEAQITSLQSLLGFWNDDHASIFVVSVAVLGVAGFWLVRATSRAHTEEEHTLAMGSWLALGMLVTYHRALDGIALLLLLPLLLNQLRRSPGDWRTWTIVGLYLSMSLGPSTGFVQARSGVTFQDSLLSFLLLRQAGIADLCLAIMLFSSLHLRLLSREGGVENARSRSNGWGVPLRGQQSAREPVFRPVELQKRSVAVVVSVSER